MLKINFGKIWILIILFVIVIGGVLAWQYWRFPGIVKEETTEIRVYFIKDIAERNDCNCNNPVIRNIPKTEAKAVLALEELIKGPTKEEMAQGYNGCLPNKETVAMYRNWYETEIITAKEDDLFANKFRSPDGEFAPWGNKIIVRGVNIKDGVAYADFSKELYSYGGGACLAESINTSINNTLLQFPAIKEVKILVEGRDAIIEP